jgi:hypothetical protein
MHLTGPRPKGVPMRSRCLLGTVVVALGAMLALPNVAGAQVPTGDSVVGNGETGIGNSFSFNVSSGPSGENPTGDVSAVFFGTFFQSTSVDCLAVSGNIATFAGALGPNTFDLTHYKVTVEDNGPTGDTVGITATTTPFDCAEPLGPEFALPLTDGEIVVVDAPALPTSKQQCKNGGWRDFGDTFKNQGQCVAFVQRGPKP